MITAMSTRSSSGLSAGFLIAGATALFAPGVLSSALAQIGDPSRVEVAPVVLEQTAPTMRLVGTVRPRLRSVLAAEVAGMVVEMPVDEGDAVKQGQILCRLRDNQLRFRHAGASAQRAELAAALAAALAARTKAKFEVDRLSRLYAEGRGTEKEQQDAQADFDAADARVEQARQAVAAQEAAVEALADDLERTTIRAPFDGRIVSKRTEIGSWVMQGGAVFEMLDLGVARVRISVPESIIRYCGVGAPVGVTVEALGKSLTGAVARVIPDGDEKARTFPIEVDIPNPQTELKAGMFVRAATPSGPRAERLVVPKDAIVLRGPVSMVFVVREAEQGHMAMPLPVEVVAEIEDRAAIQTQGLRAGEMVVVRGNEYLFSPTPVVILPRGGDPGDPAASEPAKASPPATQPADNG